MAATKKPPTLRNAYSTSTNTFNAIEKTLREHKARSIMFDYAHDDSGHIIAMSFVLEVQGRLLSFRMPARIGNVEKIFLKRKQQTSSRWVSSLTAAEKEQCYRTAWATLRDWLGVQFALVDIGAIETEEVFLPYLLNQQGQTFYEVMREQQFMLPERKMSIEEAGL